MGKLWGGRFSGEAMDPKVMEFTSSLDVDSVLAKYDCMASRVHAEMLAKCGFISGAEKDALTKALDEAAAEIENGTFSPEGYEDIHSAIQGYVEKSAPEAAKKLHTGRSRNEQVVNSVRMYCVEKTEGLVALIRGLQKSFVALAGKTADVAVPGYTHLNRAQPVLFAHLALAYTEMLERDAGRLEDAGRRLDVSVMGSGAIAGSALELDRKFVASKLGFAGISANSIDAVSDRDFMAETVSALSLVMVHLSRICEDLILYSIPEFGFIEMGAGYCTGSSLMPQKKNPDVLELVRGKSASVISALNSLLVLQKGLPHAYNRDLQEDKKPLFESVDTTAKCLAIMAPLVDSIIVNKENAVRALGDEALYATDMAEYLVRKGVAFKDAHDVVGKIVKHCAESGVKISDLSLSGMKEFSDMMEGDVFALLDPEVSVGNKRTHGSTNPEFVNKEIAGWKKKLKM